MTDDQKSADELRKFVHERMKEHQKAEDDGQLSWWRRWGFKLLKLGYAIIAIKIKEAQDREKGIENSARLRSIKNQSNKQSHSNNVNDRAKPQVCN